MKTSRSASLAQLLKARRFAALALGLLLALGIFRLGQAAELKAGVLSIGFTKSCFLGVNRNDVEASFKAFLATVGRQRGYDLEPRVQIFEDTPSLEKAINMKGVHLAVIESWQYMSMDIHKAMDSVFACMPNAKAGRNYAVLTRQGSGFNTLADLRGKEITRLEMGSTAMAEPWLETLLMVNGLGRMDTFFSRVEVVGKPSSAVLPVFFGNRHACLVDMVGFETMKELNPQLGTRLQVVAASEPCVDAVLCLSRDGWDSEAHKQDMIRGLAELHLKPVGQQILTLFKVGKLVPFQEAHLDTVRKLRRSYDQLLAGGKP